MEPEILEEECPHQEFEEVDAVSDWNDPSDLYGHGQSVRKVSVCSRCGYQPQEVL